MRWPNISAYLGLRRSCAEGLAHSEQIELIERLEDQSPGDQ